MSKFNKVLKMKRRWLVLWIVLSLWCGFTGESYIGEKGLIGHWNFDEGKGTTAKNSLGNTYDGKIYGGSKWIKGIKGSALWFDGKGLQKNNIDHLPEVILSARQGAKSIA